MKYTKFDVVEYLGSEEEREAYLSAVLDEKDPDLLRAALDDIARAEGLAKLPEDADPNREGRGLAPGSTAAR